MIAFLLFLRAARLATAIVAAHPEVEPDRAAAAAVAIVIEGGDYSDELLAAIVVNESKATLGLTGTRGEVGTMQVRLYGPDRRPRERAALSSHQASVREGVRRLDECAAWCRRRGEATIDCQLSAYRGGPRAARARKYAGARKLVRMQAELELAVVAWPQIGPTS